MSSGGKDSCYNMIQCVTEGHELVALANLYPKQKGEIKDIYTAFDLSKCSLCKNTIINVVINYFMYTTGDLIW